MSLSPRSLTGRVGLHLLLLIEVAAAVALLVALEFALGVGVVLLAVAGAPIFAGVTYRRVRKLRRLMRSDPAAAQRIADRDATRLGKLYAAFAFVTMGACTVAVIAVLVTHV